MCFELFGKREAKSAPQEDASNVCKSHPREKKPPTKKAPTSHTAADSGVSK